MKRIAILGAGAWGTSLSLTLAAKGYPVSMWVWDPDQASAMASTGENPFLPGFKLPDDLEITSSIPEAIRDTDAVIFVTISNAAVETAYKLAECLQPGIPVISATKGLDNQTGKTITQTLRGILPADTPIAAISGPNLAVEIAKRIPSAMVAACEDISIAKYVQNLLMCPSLRVYTNTDITGVELAGALKNVLAIGAGICDGLGFGDNTKAALLTRGLAEITRLGMKLGAKQSTFMGLAGIGDIITTCASPLSRNRRVGQGLGEGKTLEVVLSEMIHVAEGIPTTRAAYNLSQKNETPMPITEQVYNVLYNNKRPIDAVHELMTREPREEVW